MTECWYHLAMGLAVVGAFMATLFLISLLKDTYRIAKEFLHKHEGFYILVPTMAALAMFFIMSREVPKVINVTDCGTGERMEKIVLKTGQCKFLAMK